MMTFIFFFSNIGMRCGASGAVAALHIAAAHFD